ncbi:MAG: hypothetical protein IJO45_03135 [Oscillospiraceae bacterium]|nr:hypothetical protein [Oscillospiraceae bacterium]
MKCPRCRCEVGNQSICPYCGGTVYISSGWNTTEYSRRTANTAQGSRRPPSETRNIERKLHNLEMKVHMLLVLQGGVLALSVLALLLIALK